MSITRHPNPYHFGSPVGSDHFTDREQELEKLKSVMLNGQNLILIAPRRYGKSSLLLRAIDMVRAEGGRSGRVGLMRCSSEKDVAEGLMRAVMDGPLVGLRAHARELGRRLRRIRVAPTFKISESGTMESVTFAPSLAEVDWKEVISDVIRVLGDSAEEAHPVSLILDEFQKAFEINRSIVDVMKDVVDELPHVSLVFAGSKRHLMEAMVNDASHGALYNVGAKLYLHKIPKADFVEYLSARAMLAGKFLPQEAAQDIYDAAAGVPNDVQLIAFFAFDRAAKVISTADVQDAIHASIDDQRDEFEQAFDVLSLKQQLLLKLVARSPVQGLTGSIVQRELAVSHTAAAKAGEALESAGLIERDGPAWVVASGLMREWLVGFEE